jgi:hypothetical protein
MGCQWTLNTSTTFTDFYQFYCGKITVVKTAKNYGSKFTKLTPVKIGKSVESLNNNPYTFSTKIT